MFKLALENRKWFVFAVAIAIGIFFLFFRQHSLTFTATPVVESDPVVIGNPPNTFQKTISSAPLKFSKPNPHIARTPSAQKPPAPDRLLTHALLDSTPWKIWLGVKAIRAENKVDSDVILAKLNQIFIVESADENPTLTNFNSVSPILVYDGRLKKVGIINGLLKIQTTDRAQLEADLIELNAHIAEAFEPIKTYFVTSINPTFDLEALYQALKSKPYIKTTELDITSRSYEKL